MQIVVRLRCHFIWNILVLEARRAANSDEVLTPGCHKDMVCGGSCVVSWLILKSLTWFITPLQGAAQQCWECCGLFASFVSWRLARIGSDPVNFTKLICVGHCLTLPWFAPLVMLCFLKEITEDACLSPVWPLFEFFEVDSILRCQFDFKFLYLPRCWYDPHHCILAALINFSALQTLYGTWRHHSLAFAVIELRSLKLCQELSLFSP